MNNNKLRDKRSNVNELKKNKLEETEIEYRSVNPERIKKTKTNTNRNNSNFIFILLLSIEMTPPAKLDLKVDLHSS